MANNTIAQIYFRNFGNFDLTQAMDKTDLEGLDLPVQNTEATFVVTGDADVNASVKPKVPDSITFKVLARKIKELSPKFYNALLNPEKSRSLGSCTWSSGADTEIFSKVLIEKGLDKKGSYEMHTTIALKFIK